MEVTVSVPGYSALGRIYAIGYLQGLFRAAWKAYLISNGFKNFNMLSILILKVTLFIYL
jgi:D-mannonate dehydratase (UxuA).